MVQILLISLALTLIFELIFACIYGVREKTDILWVILVNVLTNPAVVWLHYRSRYDPQSPTGWITLGLEIAAVLIEGFLYDRFSTVPRPYFFSLTANSFSYAIGALINAL